MILVTEDTIEERMLGTLSAKHELAQAVLDVDSEIDTVDLSSGVEDLKRRLEVLVGRKPEAAIDESVRREVQATAEDRARSERVALAGGKMLDAAFTFLGELLPEAGRSPASSEAGSALQRSLNGCLSRDEQGRPTLTVTLPDEDALQRLASSLSQLMAVGAPAAEPAPVAARPASAERKARQQL